MQKVDNFENVLAVLKDETENSVFVKACDLADMGVNHKHLEEVSGRTIRRRTIIVRGSDGLPLSEIEFEFMPKHGAAK